LPTSGNGPVHNVNQIKFQKYLGLTVVEDLREMGFSEGTVYEQNTRLLIDIVDGVMHGIPSQFHHT
jgi:hypothetical protein